MAFNPTFSNDWSGFGTSSNGLTLAQRVAAQQGQAAAVKQGNTFLANAYKGILTYGVPLLSALVTAGVFKNKTQIEIARVQADALARFQSDNGNVNLAATDPNNLTVRGANNNPFGISTSNLLLGAAGVGVGFLLFNNNNGSRRRK